MTNILAALQIAAGLFKTGTEIYSLAVNKDNLSDDDLKDLIAKQDAAQAEARQKLVDLLSA